MIYAAVAITIILVGFFVFKRLSGEEQRIRTFFRVYRQARLQIPNATERELLEVVTEEHIPPGKSIQMRKIGISGQKYLEGVYGDREVDLDQIITSFIKLEFQKKYQPYRINIQELENSAEKGRPTKNDLLKQTISRIHVQELG